MQIRQEFLDLHHVVKVPVRCHTRDKPFVVDVIKGGISQQLAKYNYPKVVKSINGIKM